MTSKPQPVRCPLVVFAGGGTGGHLYPAVALAGALRDRLPAVRFLFFCTQRAVDQRVLGREQWQRVPQPIPALRRVPWSWPRFVRDLQRSHALCRSRFGNERPAVVVGTGGLGSVPAVRQAARMGIPTALLNPDVVPGRANRYLAASADAIFAQWPETIARFPPSARVVVSGCPVRPEFHDADREAGAKRFGLDAGRKTLLVTGASQGARTVNQAVLANRTLLESQGGWQVLHLTGERDLNAVRAAYHQRPVRAIVLPFTDHMADALAAADLVVGRAGASFLAEITIVGRASVLMPYPHHRDHHQLENARCLERAKAARIVHDRIDAAVNGPSLRAVLEPLMEDEALRAEMAAAAGRMGRHRAAADIAEYLLRLIDRNGAPCSGESVEALC